MPTRSLRQEPEHLDRLSRQHAKRTAIPVVQLPGTLVNARARHAIPAAPRGTSARKASRRAVAPPVLVAVARLAGTRVDVRKITPVPLRTVLQRSERSPPCCCAPRF